MTQSTSHRQSQPRIPIAIAIALAIIPTSLHNPVTWAQPQPKSSVIRYTPPPNRGTPPSNKTTGSRGNCLYHSDRPPLAPLVGHSHLSQSLGAHPTIWFYNPYPNREVAKAELILINETSDRELYRGRFPLSPTPGILGVQLPPALEPLQPEQDYRWYIDIDCQTTTSTAPSLSTPATLTGLIQPLRPMPELTQALARATPLEAIALYGQHHLWYDLLTTLARERLGKKGDRQLQQLWQELLQDPTTVGLEFLSQEPLLGEWTPSPSP